MTFHMKILKFWGSQSGHLAPPFVVLWPLGRQVPREKLSERNTLYVAPVRHRTEDNQERTDLHGVNRSTFLRGGPLQSAPPSPLDETTKKVKQTRLRYLHIYAILLSARPAGVWQIGKHWHRELYRQVLDRVHKYCCIPRTVTCFAKHGTQLKEKLLKLFTQWIVHRIFWT